LHPWLNKVPGTLLSYYFTSFIIGWCGKQIFPELPCSPPLVAKRRCSPSTSFVLRLESPLCSRYLPTFVAKLAGNAAAPPLAGLPTPLARYGPHARGLAPCGSARRLRPTALDAVPPAPPPAGLPYLRSSCTRHLLVLLYRCQPSRSSLL